MSNYNLVIDTSNFKPFDINPALQVLHDYRDAYYRLEDLMNKIAEEKGEYVLPETSKYKGVMDRYNTDYDAAVADFSKGMNLQNAQNIRNLRRRYSSEISPIRTMVLNYNKYNDKVTALGPDAIIGNVYGVDDFYGGVTPAIDYRSAKQVELDAIKYFSGINNALTQDPEFRKILGGQYYMQTQKGGVDSGAALQAALVEYNNRTNGQHSEAVQNLLGHMQNVMNSEAVDNFSDDAKKQVWNKIASGLVASIEAPKYSQVTNRAYESPAQIEARQKAQARVDAEMESKGYKYENGKYVYDEHLALTRGNNAPITTPDGDTWTYNANDKKWHSSTNTRPPLSDSGLNSEINRQIIEVKNKEQNPTENPWARDKDTYQLSAASYRLLARSFQPLTFEIEDITENGENNPKDIHSWKGNFEGDDYGDWSKEPQKSHNLATISFLPADTKQAILAKARDQIPNLEMEDLEIYIDTDDLGDDDVRVVIKDSGPKGSYTGEVLPWDSNVTTRNTNGNVGLGK